MRRIIKTLPLIIGVTSLSACSALNFGPKNTFKAANALNQVQNGLSQTGQYTQLASNTHLGTHANTVSGQYANNGYNNSGWYAVSPSQPVQNQAAQNHTPQNWGANPYAGGAVNLNTQPTQLYPKGVLTAHNGYHDAYGNPAPAPTHTSTHGPHETVVYGDPRRNNSGLRGSYGPSYYGNIGGIAYDVGDDLYGVVGRLGVQKSWYGAEVEGSFGVSDEDETVLTADPNGGADIPVNISAGVDYTVAAFATARLPFGNGFNALARLGYHNTQIGVEGSADGFSANDSEDFDGFAYGAGIEYDFDKVNGVRVDYTRYDLGGDLNETDSISATYLRRF